MKVLTTITCVLLLLAASNSQESISAISTEAPAPTPIATPAVNNPAITSSPPGQNVITATREPEITNAPAPSPTPAVIDAPAPAAPDTTIPAPVETDYPISRCGPIYTNEWCPPGPQGQKLYCSRWGFCGEGNKADEYAGMFIDINTACPSLTNAECKAKNPNHFCYVPELRCAIKVSHDQVQEHPQQKSGTVATSISAIAIVFLVALRLIHI